MEMAASFTNVIITLSGPDASPFSKKFRNCSVMSEKP